MLTTHRAYMTTYSYEVYHYAYFYWNNVAQNLNIMLEYYTFSFEEYLRKTA